MHFLVVLSQVKSILTKKNQNVDWKVLLQGATSQE